METTDKYPIVTPKMIPIHLQEHDLLLLRVPSDSTDWTYGCYERFVRQLQTTLKDIGFNHIGICCVPEECDLDIVKSEREFRTLRMEITELKQTVAKLIKE